MSNNGVPSMSTPAALFWILVGLCVPGLGAESHRQPWETYLQFYRRHPRDCEPWVVQLDSGQKPAEGKPAPRNAQRITLTSRPSDTTPYLDAVSEFLCTLMTHGTDRYGAEQSSLFADILDIQTLRMPDGLPQGLPGQRPQDRSYPGGNLAHDMLTLLTMKHVSRLTGDPKYATEWGNAAFWGLPTTREWRPGLQRRGEIRHPLPCDLQTPQQRRAPSVRQRCMGLLSDWRSSIRQGSVSRQVGRTDRSLARPARSHR